MKKLYLVTNSDKYTESEFLERIEEALKGGIDLLQLREKNKTDREVLDLAFKVKKLADVFDVPLIIDDRLDVAMAINSGVHLGADDLPIIYANEFLHGKIIGATAKTVEAAKKAESDGANYVGVGAIFETATKVKTIRTSVETLNSIKDNVNIDVYAIGGLTYDNVDILKGSKIDGICVVREIMNAENVFGKTKELKEKINGILI
ncbi:thiamine phosphate synthase [Peptoniphilus sp.]|jgi:thiamine-phosphate pyrophosphorylase|uniref:thiamine phosphate synthase n=1 Tax=Peptoniphilus sp. TaxID=1971214 RepID=UPI003D8A8118